MNMCITYHFIHIHPCSDGIVDFRFVCDAMMDKRREARLIKTSFAVASGKTPTELSAFNDRSD